MARQKQLEWGMIVLILMIVSYSLSQTVILSPPEMHVDFPTHYERRDTYLYASIVSVPQPVIVVMCNIFYEGDVITGGSGYGRGYDQLPVSLNSWRTDEGFITNVTNEICSLTFFGEAIQLRTGYAWETQGVRIERLSQFEGDYRFHYSSIIEYYGVTDHVAYLSRGVWQNRSYDHAFPVISVTVFVTTTLVLPPTLFNNIGIQILTICLSGIALANGFIIMRTRMKLENNY